MRCCTAEDDAHDGPGLVRSPSAVRRSLCTVHRSRFLARIGALHGSYNACSREQTAAEVALHWDEVASTLRVANGLAADCVGACDEPVPVDIVVERTYGGIPGSLLPTLGVMLGIVAGSHWIGRALIGRLIDLSDPGRSRGDGRSA